MRRSRQAPFQPAASLALAVGVPEASLGQRGRQPQTQRAPFGLPLGAIQGPRERRPEVGVLGFQPSQPRFLSSQLRLGRFGQGEVEARGPLPDQLRLPAILELLSPVLPDDLQEPVACRPVPLHYDQQRFGHEAGEQVEDRLWLDVLPAQIASAASSVKPPSTPRACETGSSPPPRGGRGSSLWPPSASSGGPWLSSCLPSAG